MHIKDILIKNWFFCQTAAFLNMSKTHNDLKFAKEMKMLMVVDTSLLSLTFKNFHVKNETFEKPSNLHLILIDSGSTKNIKTRIELMPTAFEVLCILYTLRVTCKMLTCKIIKNNSF